MNSSTEHTFDTWLSLVLRAGVLLSAALVAFGGIIFLTEHGFDHPDYTVFRGEPEALRSLRGILREALRLDAGGIIQAGLLLLIATPVARVVFSVAGFARQRDWLYVGITLIVLTLLGYSMIAGS
jgi:uncharacterized membrane protein